MATQEELVKMIADAVAASLALVLPQVRGGGEGGGAGVRRTFEVLHDLSHLAGQEACEATAHKLHIPLVCSTRVLAIDYR